jgi:hypothetical protein
MRLTVVMDEPQDEIGTWKPRRSRRRVVLAGTAVALLAGGGAAYAAKQVWSPKEERQAVLNDAAKRLGVTPQKLDTALKQALEARIDAAVAAGRITKAQGDAMKQRIESGDTPFFFGGGGPGYGHRGHGFGGPGFGRRGGADLLGAAAKYLGLTEAQLQEQRQSGKTLEQIAQARKKSVSGLKGAMTAAIKTQLDAAVKAGKLTKDQETQVLKKSEALVQHLLTENEAQEHRGGFGFGGPPPGQSGGDGAAPAGSAST